MRVQVLRPYSLFFLLFLLFRAGFVSSVFPSPFSHARSHTSFVFAPSLSLSLSLAFFSSRSLQHKPTQPRVYTTSLSFVIHLPQEVTRAPRQQDTVSFRSPLPLVPRFKRTRSRTLTLTLSFLFNTSHTHTHTHSAPYVFTRVTCPRLFEIPPCLVTSAHTDVSSLTHRHVHVSSTHTSFTKRPP